MKWQSSRERRRRRGGRSTVFRGGEISRYAHAGSFNGVCYENFAAAASGNEEGRFRKSDESAKSPGEITWNLGLICQMDFSFFLFPRASSIRENSLGRMAGLRKLLDWKLLQVDLFSFHWSSLFYTKILKFFLVNIIQIYTFSIQNYLIASTNFRFSF